MTFNDNADISGGNATRGGGGGRGLLIGGGGGGLLVVGLILLSQLLGVDVTGLTGGGSSSSSDGTNVESLDRCKTGADANTDLDCRMKGASAALDTYWTTEYPTLTGDQYQSPAGFTLFSGSTNTGCGGASSSTGPFYCPADEILYVDTSFFDELKTRYGSSGGSLAQLYVVAHEWGHHIQKLDGVLDKPHTATGAASTSVRIELQADCYAGAWVGSASTVPDENGVPFLKTVTTAQVTDALSAAAAVGDDRIQAASGQVDPESFTHGTSAQREKWFLAGKSGGAAACDTFAPSGSTL